MEMRAKIQSGERGPPTIKQNKKINAFEEQFRNNWTSHEEIKSKPYYWSGVDKAEFLKIPNITILMKSLNSTSTENTTRDQAWLPLYYKQHPIYC